MGAMGSSAVVALEVGSNDRLVLQATTGIDPQSPDVILMGYGSLLILYLPLTLTNQPTAVRPKRTMPPPSIFVRYWSLADIGSVWISKLSFGNTHRRVRAVQQKRSSFYTWKNDQRRCRQPNWRSGSTLFIRRTQLSQSHSCSAGA